MAPKHSIRALVSRAVHLVLSDGAPSTVARYKFVDLVVVISVTAVAMICILAGSSVAIRTIFALPLVLVLPGYAIVAATFSRSTLGVAERLLMSLGVSLAVTALAGIALNWTTWGLTPTTWSILLGSVTLGASIAATLTRARWREQLKPVSGAARFDFSARQGVLLGLAVVTLIGAMMIARNAALEQPSDGSTHLWIQSISEDNQHQTVRIGVKNMESTTEKYTVSITVGGNVVTGWSLTLKPDQEWEGTVVVPIRQLANAPVEAVLYRSDAPQTVYRYVILWHSK